MAIYLKPSTTCWFTTTAKDIICQIGLLKYLTKALLERATPGRDD
jgi:hypothetical protein